MDNRPLFLCVLKLLLVCACVVQHGIRRRFTLSAITDRFAFGFNFSGQTFPAQPFPCSWLISNAFCGALIARRNCFCAANQIGRQKPVTIIHALQENHHRPKTTRQKYDNFRVCAMHVRNHFLVKLNLICFIYFKRTILARLSLEHARDKLKINGQQ